MSYALSAALQEAIYTRLTSDAGVVALAGPHVYDTLPEGAAPPLYVTLGAEAVKDAGDATGAGALHDLTLAVTAAQGGFLAAKQLAAAIGDALIDADLPLAQGSLVWLRFLKARAAQSGAARRIDITFRARVAAD